MRQDRNSISTETLLEEIRGIYNSDALRAGTVIEQYLEQQLRECSAEDKLIHLEELTRELEGFQPLSKQNISLEQKDVSQLLSSLLLGEKVSMENLGSDELIEKLSQSLNTVFDTLNQIITVINTTLLGRRVEFDTIRTVIGFDIEEGAGRDSLQNYLDQIREAFLVAHKAFQQAADAMVLKILDELDPDTISADADKGLTFGPFRKAENFEIYKEKVHACKTWLESGQLTVELLKEFEKICQKLYKVEARSL